jgi:phage-related tail fiber protein
MALTHLRSATADKRPSPGVMSDGQIAINTNTGSPGLFFKDSNGSLVKVGPVHIGSTAPNSSPAVGGQTGNSKGEIWLDNSAGGFVVKIWDGTAWRSESGQFVDAAGDTMTGALVMDNQQQVRFREASANGTNFIGLQAPASVASDKTITLPDVTGTVVTTGDTGTVTSAMIVDGTITNTDINASAAIADTKLATISTANKVSASALDIDGATDIGAALADADLILVDDGGAGTNRKAAITRVTDYTFGKVSGDITITSAGAASLPSTGTAGTYTKVTTDAKGRVTSGTTLSVSDVPTLTSAKISDFDTQVRTSRLDQMAAPTGALSANNQKITNLATPTADSDAANKGYVDAVKQSLDIKDSVRVATTANITLSGLQTIDGVSVAANDRVLVKDQTTASANGIYVASSSAWVRSTDTDTSAKVTAGLFVFVTEGSTNADSGWVLTTHDAITLGTTSLSFSQFSGAGQITSGAGLTKTGNTLDVGTASSARIVVNADNIDLATSGVTAGTYRSVTTDTYGRITAGTNPTTLSGYGITDAATSTHTHGNITNAGAIGTTANLPVITTTSGVLTTGTFGSAANTFCQGNDSRLSDTRNTTNTVTFNNGGSGGASGSTFNGGSALTVSYNTVGAPSTTGTNASGTWGISITGDAASVDGKSFGTFSAAGGILYATSTTAASAIGAGAAGQLLKSGVSGAPTWATLEMTDVPGATYKKSVRVATTAALTATLSGNVLTNSGILAALAIDGVTLAANDRVLVKDQTTGAHNGIYYVSNIGSGTVAWTLTRGADADANTEIGSGVVAVDTGTTNGGRLYTTTFKATDTLNTTSMPWHEILYNSGTWAINTTGNAATATTLATTRNINGVPFNGSIDISVNTNNTVTFNNAGSGATSGSTFNGGSALTVSYNTVGAPSTTGTNASGTWNIGISGNAATATTATNWSAIPAGTAMLFIQSSAPTGWTKSTTHNNKALRITSGTASSGGTTPFTSVFDLRSVNGTVGSTTLTEGQMPNHTHGYQITNVNDPSYASGTVGRPRFTQATTTNNAGGSLAHSHSFTGETLDFAVAYVDAIIATKN